MSACTPMLDGVRKPTFPRQIHGGEDGDDVYGHKRAIHRYLEDGLLDDLEAKPVAVRRHAGEGFRVLVVKAQKKARQPQDGIFKERLYNELWRVEAYDTRATNLVIRYNMLHPALTICHPIPSNYFIKNKPALHETGGLPGNWALDWIVDPGAPVLAVEKATITRLSGSPPSQDVNDPAGVYGWSTYYSTSKGVNWFWTHQGERVPGLHVGQIVDVGEPIGFVGDQKYRDDHAHGGCSHPLGEAAARKHVLAVNAAPRVTL